MTFHISPVVAQAESVLYPEAILGSKSHCFCCGESLTKASDGPVVEYHVFPTPGDLSSILMHRDCAFAMAQRIICDTWPNRRVGDVLMKNDR